MTDKTDPANNNAVIAVFINHPAAEAAVKKLAGAGIDMKHLSVVGKGYHTDEKVIGFYNTGDRMAFWGKRGAFWGGLWGWLMGGAFLFVPVVGHVVVLGYLATAVVAAIEAAVVVGGLSALGAPSMAAAFRRTACSRTRPRSRPTAFSSPRTAQPMRWRGPRPSSARSAPRASISTTARPTCS